MKRLERVAAILFVLLYAASLAATVPSYQVVNVYGDTLGVFGGLAPATNAKGEVASAVTVITPTGYLAQLSRKGDLGVFPVLYFSAAGCADNEYVSAASVNESIAAMGGMLYRSLASGQVRYIAKHAQTQATDVKSRMYFDADNKLQCEHLNETLPVLATAENDADQTEFRQEFVGSTVALEPVDNGAEPERVVRPSLLERMRTGDGTSRQDIPFEHQECSPSCAWQSLGDNFCDVSCYVDACNYDGGDCDNETPEFLQEEMAKMCSPGCEWNELADGFCDAGCNNSACEYDRGDCKLDP
jgi:hypothetical protein